MSIRFSCRCRPRDRSKYIITQYRYYWSYRTGKIKPTKSSQVQCTVCGAMGRTKAAYVNEIYNAQTAPVDGLIALTDKLQREGNTIALNDINNRLDMIIKANAEIINKIQGKTAPRITTIEKVKKGDYFKLLFKGGRASTQVYVAQGYNHEARKYWYVPFNDVLGAGYGRKKGTTVVIDFDF